MTSNDLRSRYKDQVPFTSTELKDDLLKAAARDAINFYNLYDPIIRTDAILTTTYEYSFSTTGLGAPENVLRVYAYSLGIYNNGTDNLVYDWDYEKPTLYISPGQYFVKASYNYTLAGLTTAILDTKHYLSKLIREEIILAASDKRRMANLNELPIDFKGDQFSSEAEERKKELYEKIQELVTNIHF